MISLNVYSLRSQVVERSVQKAGVLVISWCVGRSHRFIHLRRALAGTGELSMVYPREWSHLSDLAT